MLDDKTKSRILKVLNGEIPKGKEPKKDYLSRAIEFAGRAYNFSLAIATGKIVSEERQKARMEICSKCPKVTKDNFGRMSCGICGCKLKGSSEIIQLTAYEETDRWGCKHPKGSRWKAEGV